MEKISTHSCYTQTSLSFYVFGKITRKISIWKNKSGYIQFETKHLWLRSVLKLTLSSAFHSALWKLITAEIYYLEIWWSFFKGTPISNVRIATPKYTANIFFPGLNWGVSCSAVIFHYVQLWLVLEIFTASHLHTDTLNSTAHTFFLLLILTVFELVNNIFKCLTVFF